MAEADRRVVQGSRLLTEAATIFDSTPALAEASQSARPSFASGAEWMRSALGTLRAEAPGGSAAFNAIGCVKYIAAAVAAAIPVAVAVVTRSAWPLALVVPAFYAAEVQSVFAFPAALDGAARPIATSRTIVRSGGGTLRSVVIVVPIAAYMLGGGFFGRGFRRSWCVGCLAVLLWYEAWRPVGPNVPREPA